MIIYALISKETLRFIREEKGVSYEYIDRIAGFSKERLNVWEDIHSEKFPKINQAKSLAKCYRIPFAGFYMNTSDIKLQKTPKLKNLRTIQDADIDDTALNLAISDVLDARDLFIETKSKLKEPVTIFDMDISTDDVCEFARLIRLLFDIRTDEQYRCKSARKFYLYVRDKIEAKGIFVHCFSGVSTEIVRGFAVFDEIMPVIGINEEDRYPAKTFSIIHELVHVFKRNSAVCNEMFSSFSIRQEEIFCNAVAGEVLVPKDNLIKQIGARVASELTYDVVEELAEKFSVSKEVISRRLFDIGKIDKGQYEELSIIIKRNFEREKEVSKEVRKLLGKGIPRNIPRETVDRTSTALCKAFYSGYSNGYFDRQDISRYLGVKQTHIEKFLLEVSKWKI